ncbi:MAG TPA: HdeD family acid-resistance protein [Anaerolineae bacterium]|nr:HdeD family acid-resistance protein [Anaerolineae bacterium]
MATATASQQGPTVPWWLVLLEGIALVILGALLLTNPASTTFVLIQFLGIYWLVKGIFELVAMFIDHRQWGWKLFSGILGIIAGIVILQHPLWATLLVPATLVWLLGFFGVIMGGISIFQAFKGGGWVTGLLGVLSIIFGLYLLANTFISTLSFPWVLGIFALIGGAVAIWNSFKVRSLQKA